MSAVDDPREMSDDQLRDYLAANEWYHTVELRPGIETPGWFDTRPAAATLPWPDLRGARCLDVGTFEGFWAREMSARGAREVLAIDILDPLEWDWPVGSDAQVVAEVGRRKRGGVGFTFVGRALDSDIECRELSVYDLDPNLVGTFDFVYLGSVLLHLRDPIRALERIRSVLNPDGRLLVVDAIDKELTIRHPRRPIAELDGDGRPWWWKPNLAGLGRMVSAAGFDLLTKPKTIYLKPGRGQPLPGWKPTLLRNAAGRELLLTKWRGDAHASVLAARRPG